MKICVDLCCGLGGFSEAFKNDSNWKVVTVDIEERFKPSVCADITKINWEEFKKQYLNGANPNVLVASPPCNHFSLACLQFPRKGIQLALEIVGACFEAVAILNPEKWLIENPRGRLRRFIGKPKQTIRYSDYDKRMKRMKTTDLWGNLMLPMVNGERRIKGTGLKNHLDRLHKGFPHAKTFMEKAERAKIPIGVSLAVKEGYELTVVQKDNDKEKTP